MKAKAEYEIAVGMVLTGEAKPSPALIQQISEGMSVYFASFRWNLIHAHTGISRSCGIAEAPGVERQTALAVPWAGIQHVSHPWHGLPGKTAAYRAIFDRAHQDSATVCLLVDPGQVSFEPASVDSLIRPGLHSLHDLVTPVPGIDQRRHLLSSNLVSPMLRSLFGDGSALPLSGTFAVSRLLIERLLSRQDWDSMAARFVPELWINFTAGAEGYRRAEAFTGKAVRRPSLSPLPEHKAIHQIVEGLFSLMEQYETHWLAPANRDPLEKFGRTGVEPSQGARNDGLKYLVRFVQSHNALRDQWKALLDPNTFYEVDTFAAALLRGETGAFLADQAWVRVVYEMASHWKHRRRPRSQITALLVPLYWARVGSFLMKNQWSDQDEIRQQLARLRGYFQALRPALSDRWTGRSVRRSEVA